MVVSGQFVVLRGPEAEAGDPAGNPSRCSLPRGGWRGAVGAEARDHGPAPPLGGQQGRPALGTAGDLQAGQVPGQPGKSQPGKQNISLPGEKQQHNCTSYSLLLRSASEDA